MKPNNATVSTAAFQAISDALDSIRDDPGHRRTKRQIEQLAALSHATVARAFAQDAHEPTQWRINERFDELAAATGRRSVSEQKTLDLQSQLALKQAEIRELREERTVHLQALYAYFLAANSGTGETASVTPIRRRERS